MTPHVINITANLDTDEVERKIATLYPQVKELATAVEAFGRALRDLPPIPVTEAQS